MGLSVSLLKVRYFTSVLVFQNIKVYNKTINLDFIATAFFLKRKLMRWIIQENLSAPSILGDLEKV